MAAVKQVGAVPLEEARKYAPVLARMIDILSAGDNVRFGDAMNQAARELGIPVPEHMQGPMLSVVFKMFGERRFPGAADA